MAYIRYDGFDEWHERLVLGHIQNDEYMIVTPDFDFYPEQLSANNGDLDGFRVQGAGGVLPVGVQAFLVYGFAAMTGADRAQVMAEGKQLVDAERAARGLVVRPGAPLPAAAAAAVVAAPPPPALPGPPGGLPVGMPPLGAPPAGGALAAASAATVRPPVAPGVARVAGPQGTWVIDEPGEHANVGDEIALPAGAL